MVQLNSTERERERFAKRLNGKLTVTLPFPRCVGFGTLSVHIKMHIINMIFRYRTHCMRIVLLSENSSQTTGSIAVTSGFNGADLSQPQTKKYGSPVHTFSFSLIWKDENNRNNECTWPRHHDEAYEYQSIGSSTFFGSKSLTRFFNPSVQACDAIDEFTFT